MTQWNRSIRQEVIEGAYHDIGYANSAEVIDILTSVLREDME